MELGGGNIRYHHVFLGEIMSAIVDGYRSGVVGTQESFQTTQ